MNEQSRQFLQFSIKHDLSDQGRGWIYPTNHSYDESKNGQVIEIAAYDQAIAKVERFEKALRTIINSEFRYGTALVDGVEKTPMRIAREALEPE